MRYETPELRALVPAISAIQDTPGNSKLFDTEVIDSSTGDDNDVSMGYADWE
jgi:hypothetical protein